jgi:hypothetical protein
VGRGLCPGGRVRSLQQRWDDHGARFR